MFNVKHGSKSEAKVRKNRAAFLSSQNQILSGSGSLPGVPDASALPPEPVWNRKITAKEATKFLLPLTLPPFCVLGTCVKNETRL